MAVTFSDILTRYAMQEINDEYWNEELALSPARFFRAKSDLLIDSIPLFSRPPEAQEWLSFQAPTYGDYLYMAEGDQTAPFIIEGIRAMQRRDCYGRRNGRSGRNGGSQ